MINLISRSKQILLKTLANLIKIASGFGIALLIVSSFTSIQVYAQQTCTVFKDINVGTVFDPTKFIPIIPEDCSNGTKALGLEVLPDIAIRLYGFFTSIGFYLLFLSGVAAGIFWIYGGYDESIITQAKKVVRNATIGVFILIASYTIILEILGFILGAGEAAKLTGTTISTLFSR